MIKLKQLIKESLKNMVFSKTMKPRHKKRLSKKITLFPQNPKLTIKEPPANDSNKTRAEVFYLLSYNDGVIDNEMVQAYDNIVKAFMPIVEKNGLQVSSDEIQEIVSGPQSSGNVAIRGTLTKEGKDVFSSSIVTSAPTSGSGFPTGHIFFVV